MALGADLPANDRRQDYLRATVAANGDGRRTATPYGRQDSSMLALLAAADGLIVRAPHAPAIAKGAPVEVLSFPQLLPGLRSEEHTSELQSLMRNSYAVFCL